MWAAIIVVVLVCGYLYTSQHLPSRFKLQKAVGWNAYFLVALKGGSFLISGFFVAFFCWVVLWLLMFIGNVPYYLGANYAPFEFTYTLFNLRFMGLSMPSITVLGCTVMVSVGAAKKADKDSKNPQKMNEIFKELAKESATENLLLESIERGLLLLISLKSRKVYVGMVDEARFANVDTDTIVIIPFMSGYRDKDTLTFCVEHNYADHYQSEGITLTSEPLSVYQYRHVLPIEQIESLSLFNAETYESFQETIRQKKLNAESEK
ncbi:MULTISPECIES: hypothetical protein [Yersinia]|uniref:hypothetical protein n=1 Tax=Yersinia TaxID=629 RepID=UPI0006597966|nr:MULTISPECIES: hypothetical protein [Yersinia]CRX53887.1 Uncharacterised protein [Yersinia enterocolitica]